jgi:SAM-dependent methyltransferase
MGAALALSQAQDIIADCSQKRDYYRAEYRGMESYYLPDLCRWLEEREPGNVCEVGPGHGTMIPWLASRGWRVTVMDLMPRGHWISPELLGAWQACYRQRDIIDAPANGAYDLVIMTQVIPHLQFRPDRALRHCAEMLKPGAPFITTALDRAFYPDLPCAYDYWRDVPQYGVGHPCPDEVVCMYDEAAFRELLETVFGAVAIWHSDSAAVMFAECYI